MDKIIKRIEGYNNSVSFDSSSIVKYINIEVIGHRNIIKVENGARLTNQKIIIYGNDNLIIIGSDAKVRGKPNLMDDQLIEVRGDGNNINVGCKSKVHGQLILKGTNKSILIGDGATLGQVYFLAAENSNIEIGKDCMFSHGITLRTSDAHSVIDTRTGKRKNWAADIKIGEHVWVGMNALITKGSVIPDGCIVATGAVVTKVFKDKNCSIGGIPAKILSFNTSWDRRLLKE